MSDSAFVLSTTGSGRATAYLESGKIVTCQGRTHVTWLDSPPEGFRVKIRTLDHATGEWSGSITIGEAIDNHGGPALTIDGEGYLHVVYFSHHHPFRYHRSVRPNDATEWAPLEQFGTDLTYPTLVCGADGGLILLARRSFEDRPWELELWRKPKGAAWTRQGSLLKSQRLNYSQYGASLAWSKDHQSLTLSFRIYEQPSYDKQPGCFTAVGCMKSPDAGVTWTKMDGTELALPATGESVDILCRTQSAEGRVLDAGALALSPAGVPFLCYSMRLDATSETYLATLDDDGRWTHLHMNQFLPAGWRDAFLVMAGGLTFGGDGLMRLVAPVVKLQEGKSF